MSEVEELKAQVRKLPKESLTEFRNWFHEFENELWDREIQADFKAGKFDRPIITEARTEFATEYNEEARRSKNERPPRMKLSREETLRRMKDFSKRKEKFIAAVRNGSDQVVYP